MNCPECASDNLCVYETRHTSFHVYRKRRCKDCNAKFITEEYVTEAEKFPAEIINKTLQRLSEWKESRA